jgi:hypothetical protein
MKPCETCGKTFDDTSCMLQRKVGGCRRKFCSVACRNAPRLAKSREQCRARYAYLKQMGARPDRASYGAGSNKRRDEVLAELSEDP